MILNLGIRNKDNVFDILKYLLFSIFDRLHRRKSPGFPCIEFCLVYFSFRFTFCFS